jgi:hypothetical protein
MMVQEWKEDFQGDGKQGDISPSAVGGTAMDLL